MGKYHIKMKKKDLTDDMFTNWEIAFWIGIAILGICLVYNLKLEAVEQVSEQYCCIRWGF
jgi:hypothetical protein